MHKLSCVGTSFDLAVILCLYVDKNDYTIIIMFRLIKYYDKWNNLVIAIFKKILH